MTSPTVEALAADEDVSERILLAIEACTFVDIFNGRVRVKMDCFNERMKREGIHMGRATPPAALLMRLAQAWVDAVIVLHQVTSEHYAEQAASDVTDAEAAFRAALGDASAPMQREG